jgi:hypothetical protein
MPPPWGPKRHASNSLLNNNQACPPPSQHGLQGLQQSAHVSSDHMRAGGLVFGRLDHASIMPATNGNPAPSGQEGSGTFWMATWNMVDGRVMRLKQAATGLAQMGIGVAVLTETKFVDDWYPKTAAGYTIMSLKAASCSQGGVALVWREKDLKFEVKSVLFHGPNTLIFQLTMGDEQIYVVGMYIPPNCTRGVEDICRAAEACPVGCKLLVMGDLNINVGLPRDKWEEVIADLLDELCLVDLSRGYRLRTPRRTTTRARWTWSQKRGTTRHYSQQDYVLAQAEENGMFTSMGFCFPSFLHSDHCAIVAVIRAGGGGAAEEVPTQAP